MEKELSKFSDDNLVDATWEEVDDFNSIMADWFETPAKIEQLGRGGFKLISQTLAEEPRFDYKRITLKFDITHSQFTSFYTAEAASQQFFEEMFEKYVSPIPSSNLVRMVIQHRLFDPKPIQIPFIGKDQFVPAIMFKMFYNTMQSKKNQGMCVCACVCVDIFHRLLIFVFFNYIRCYPRAGKRSTQDHHLVT